MKKPFSAYKFLLILFIPLMLFSCNEEDFDQEDTSSQQLVEVCEDITLSADIYLDIFNQATESIIRKLPEYDSLGYDSTYLSTGAFISMNTPAGSEYPATIIVDFKTGKTDNQGITRKGKISTECSGYYGQTDAQYTILCRDYYVGTHEVKGRIKIVNKGVNVNGQPIFSFSVDSSQIHNHVTDEYYSFSCNWEGVQTFTDTTWRPLQTYDTYLFTGNAEGITKKNLPYTLKINTAFSHYPLCSSINGGTGTVTMANRPPFVFDYGSGECDERGVVVYNGTEYPFRLLY